MSTGQGCRAGLGFCFPMPVDLFHHPERGMPEQLHAVLRLDAGGGACERNAWRAVFGVTPSTFASLHMRSQAFCKLLRCVPSLSPGMTQRQPGRRGTERHPSTRGAEQCS